MSAIRILLPVWGGRYVAQFLAFCLPSLLAEGNLPALRQRAPCTFVLFTRARDAEAIRRNAYFQALERLCAVEIEAIDDLISASHSTIITIAYASGIRSSKTNMLDTCFIFLVSDYVLADGALDNAAQRIFAGFSGVLVGNFQLAIEGAGAGPAGARRRATPVDQAQGSRASGDGPSSSRDDRQLRRYAARP